MLTASNADRVVACPASEVLPHIKPPPGLPAAKGNSLHGYFQRMSMGMDVSTYLQDMEPEWRQIAINTDIRIALMDLQVIGVEMAYILDVEKRTVTFLGSDIGREYEKYLGRKLTKYEIPYTGDVEAVCDGVPVELDWKTGQHLGEIEERWQRRIGAIVMALKYDAMEAQSRVVYVDAKGAITPEEHTFSYKELMSFCDTLKATKDAEEDARIMLSQGMMPTVFPDSERQCRYCPARDYCPSTTALVRQFTNEPLTPVQVVEKLRALSPREQGGVMLKVKAAKRIIEAAEEFLKERAKDTPLPADDGYIYDVLEKAHSYFDAEAAREKLIELGISDEELSGLWKKTTRKEVRRLKVAK